MKLQLFSLLLLANGMNENKLPLNMNGECALEFQENENFKDEQSDNSNDIDDAMVTTGLANQNKKRLSEVEYLEEIERSDLTIKKDKILINNENGGFFQEIKSLSSEIIVNLADNVAMLTALAGWNIYGLTCSPVWGESGLPDTDDFLCNVLLYVLDLRKTIFVVLFFSMFRAVANSFFKSHIEDPNVEKSYETRKYYNSLEGLVDQENNSWASLNGAHWLKPLTWYKMKPVYISIQFQAILRLIGMRIICQYYIYALFAAVGSSPNGYGYSDIYFYATVGSIVQLFLEIVLEVLAQFACSNNSKFGNGLRNINRVLAMPNKFVSLVVQKHLSIPSEMLYHQYEALIMSQGGLNGQTYLLSKKTPEEIRKRYRVDDNVPEWVLSCRWLKTLGHAIEDSYFAFVIIHALHANTLMMGWGYWLMLFILNFAYVTAKDKERVWYMRFLNQFIFAFAYGYYSVKLKALPKTFISMMVPGQMVRALIGSFWNMELFYTNAQDLYGDSLNDTTGEAILRNIFNGLSRPADSFFGVVKNSLIVMLGVFSIMGMIFPDPQTPIDRLLSRFSQTFKKALFYLVSGMLVSLSYWLFLYGDFNDPTDGMNNDLHFLQFIVAYKMVSLAIMGLFKIWDFEETQDVIQLLKSITTQCKKKSISNYHKESLVNGTNKFEISNELQQSLVDQKQFNDDLPNKIFKQ